ncbi:MAG: HEAT repeat domain-containing protein, partial [Chthoniobacterales bacterium]|nr:HEAT repeat domain-containing protein [Chthoniobacterales bacterium]
RIGATFKSTDTDFVTSAHPDFHPSDVLEDADGSVLVVDTGGWYVQHCPTGKIRDSRAPGGIYRVRASAVERVSDPWGLDIEWAALESATLAKLLLDPRPVVRRKAESALVRRGEGAIEHLRPLIKHHNAVTQSHAAWALAAVGSDDALAPMRQLIADDPNHPVALSALGHCADKKVAPALEHWIGGSKDAAVRLALANALIRCGTAASVPSILAALASETDRFVEHALIVALHRLADENQLAAALQDGNTRLQKAALLLLDQPPHRSVTAAQVVARLSVDDAGLRKTAQSILARQTEWVSDALCFFHASIENPKLSTEDERRLAETILAFAARQEVVDWLGDVLADPSKQLDASRRIFILQTMALVGRPMVATRWVEPLRGAVDDPVLRAEAVRAIAALQMPELDEPLLRLTADASASAQVRIDALRGVIERHPNLSPAVFEFLVTRFEPGEAATTRLAAAEVIAKAKLTEDQFARLLPAVANDSMASPDTLYPLLLRSATPATAQALVDYVANAIKKGWRPDEEKLAALLAPLRASHTEVAESLLAHVRREKDRQGERLTSLESLLAGGDETRGRAIFLDKRVACATCHRVGETGGLIGPDLTKVGAIRSGRDILESIVFPASTVAQGYENYVLTLKGGQELAGIISEKTADSVMLRDSSGAERRLAAEQIVNMRRDRVSIMPEGLDSALTPEEF